VNVRARDWITFDAGPATLTTEAELIVGLDGELRVAVRLLRGTALLFEAEVVAAEGAPLPPLPPLAAPQPPRWRDDELYTTGMFHGPLFQGIRRLIAWDGGGLDAELADTPLDGFFGWGPSAPEGLLLNPVLLDLTGHVTAFWIAQGLGTDFSSFPSSIDRIDLPAAREEATAGAVLSGRTQFLDAEGQPGADPAKARFLQGDFTCTGADGTVLMRASGWKDRFFRVPHSFYDARYRPREAWYGAEAQGLFAGQPPGVMVWQVPAFPPGFLEDAGGIWMRVLAATILSGAEREAFAAMTGPGKRRRDWIMGRIALKEAARAWILQQTGLLLLPADVEIAVGLTGKPYLAAAGASPLLPELSLAHAAGAALAVAAPPGQAVGIDMEFPAGIDAGLLAEGGFAPAERALLAAAQPGPEDAARLLTGWCAKEAAAKAIGEGLTGRPRAFVLRALAAGATVGSFTAEVDTPTAGRLQVALARQGEAVLALALR